MIRKQRIRLIFECIFAAVFIVLASAPLRAEYECENNLECLQKANQAMEDMDLDAAIYYWERDIEIAEELAVEYPEDKEGTYYVFHHAGHMLVTCLFERARIFGRFNFPERAIEDYSRILEVQETYPVNEHEIPVPLIYTFRAWEYFTVSEYENAIEDYNGSIDILEDIGEKEIEELLADNYTNRGYVYYFMNEIEKASGDLDKALQLNADYTLAKCVVIEIDLSFKEAQAIKEMLDRDMQECADLEDDSAYIEAFRIIHESIKETGSFPDAQTVFTQAGEAMQKDEYRKAAALYKVCAYLEPGNPIFTYNLALAFALNEEADEALIYYYRYLRLKPDASDREDVLEIINELHPKESMYDLTQMYMDEMEDEEQ